MSDKAQEIIRRKINTREEQAGHTAINADGLWQRLDKEGLVDTRRRPNSGIYWAAAALLLVIATVAIRFRQGSNQKEVVNTGKRIDTSKKKIAINNATTVTNAGIVQQSKPPLLKSKKKIKLKPSVSDDAPLLSEEETIEELQQITDPRAELLSVTMEHNKQIEELLVY